jgi:hypothetical protein
MQDTSTIIPQLKRRAGLTNWRVFEEGIKPDSRKARKMVKQGEKRERKKGVANLYKKKKKNFFSNLLPEV